jgi:adenosylcobyric acid synthase
MIVGCTSSAGKSLVVTGLCRWFERQGVDVAPFKAQNMSNNARVVHGGEIGLAQWLQSLAARKEPTTEMNPVLLKPEADTRSQVVVNGQVRHDLTAMAWQDRGDSLWAPMHEAFDSLVQKHELIVIEGAGSPAEINLQDLVNNRMMEHADASALLVADIDRGGAFAHLYGTWSLVPESTRSRMGAYVLNKFRGDAALLEPGPSMLQEMTGMQLAGVLPMLHHSLPDEEGATLRATPYRGNTVVGIVRYPFSSNLDEFHLLPYATKVRWVTEASDVDGCDLIILPGSKHVAADMAWMRSRGLDDALSSRAADGGRIIGVCGGCMMLGEEVLDEEGVEGATSGLGLLPIKTIIDPVKITRCDEIRIPILPGGFSGLSGIATSGYEIRNGRVIDGGCRLGPRFWGLDSIVATTVHGLFEDPTVLEALFGTRPDLVLERTFDELADTIEENLDTELLWEMVSKKI